MGRAAPPPPAAAPVIAATRLRKGNIDSGHGAARLIGDSLATLASDLSERLRGASRLECSP